MALKNYLSKLGVEDKHLNVIKNIHWGWGEGWWNILFLVCCGYTAAAAAVAAKSLQLCQTLCDPIDAAHQALPSLGFSRQERWSGLPFPTPMHESEK